MFVFFLLPHEFLMNMTKFDDDDDDDDHDDDDDDDDDDEDAP